MLVKIERPATAYVYLDELDPINQIIATYEEKTDQVCVLTRDGYCPLSDENTLQGGTNWSLIILNSRDLSTNNKYRVGGESGPDGWEKVLGFLGRPGRGKEVHAFETRKEFAQWLASL